MRRDLPSGTVTFLFTDIEGSTRLLDALGDRYGEALEAHRRLLREAFEEGGGVEVDTQGDAFFVAFDGARDVHLGARICAVAQGGQVLVSRATRDLLDEAPGDGLSLLDLGSHRLKDLMLAQKLYQLVVEGLESRFPPIRRSRTGRRTSPRSRRR